MRLFLAIALILCCPAIGDLQPGRSWSFRPQAAGGGGDPMLPFGGLVSTNGLVAAWRFDESSAGTSAVTRNDSFGANHLTDISTFAASGAGVISTNSVDIEMDDVNALTVADNASLSMSNGTSFTITCWIRPETVASTLPIISKGSGTGAATEYVLFANLSTDFRARIGDTVNQATVTNTLVPVAGNVYFLALRVDLAADIIKLNANASAGSVAYTGDTVNGASAVNIGRLVYSTGTRFDGLIDEMYIWKRVLSDAEITSLFGGGAGLDY